MNKVLGDGIMALFGAPIAHEDHAVGLLRGLAMQEALREFAERTRRRFGVEVQVRTGIHSGEVVVRTIGNDLPMDYTRWADHAPRFAHGAARPGPDTIRMAETLRLAEGYVQVRALGPIPVKGHRGQSRPSS